MNREGLALTVLEDATPENLDPDGYLWFNKDLADAAQASASSNFARTHMKDFGISEHRIQLATASFPLIAAGRASKMATLFDRSPGSTAKLEVWTDVICGCRAELFRVSGESRLPVLFERVSSNAYDPETERWFDDNPTSLFLDLGAGLRSAYRPNVVYVEIASLPTTDVLAFGDALPFDDNTFDGIVCLAVLEHVPDPFAVAREMVRVVRPRGRLVVDWPFLQPVHGYPHHYFNATEEGAREAFERIEGVGTVESWVPQWFHPAFTLRWFLDEWRERLPEPQQRAFLKLSVADILGQDVSALCGQDWSVSLPPDRQSAISAGTRLTVTKRPEPG